jgi:RNase adapter protein RapZ
VTAKGPELAALHARVVVVTGLSGAGKSTALHALEDLGYFSVDNLPPPLLERTVEVCEAGAIRRIAICVDVRVGAFLEGASDAVKALAGAHDLAVLFLDASDETLIRRFSETRRPHPLTASSFASDETPRPGSVRPVSNEGQLGAVAVLDGVTMERERLAPLRALADIVIDTTALSVHELRRQVIAHLGPGKGVAPRMLTRFLSFGFKYGVPTDADIVLDVRHLQNPFFVPELKALPGTDPRVIAYVTKNPETGEFIAHAEALLAHVMPRYEREGKSYLTVAIGCTGGRHRSVVVASSLAERLRPSTKLPVSVLHRDVGRADILGGPGSVGRGGEGGSRS